MHVVKVEVIQNPRMDSVLSMLDYHHPEDWIRLWPQDGSEYITEKLEKFLGEGFWFPEDIMNLILNMNYENGDQAVLLKNPGKGLIELYLI